MNLGTHTGAVAAPGGSVLPPGMSVRYDMAAAPLQPCVTGYNCYHADDDAESVDCFLPAPAMICIGVHTGTMAARIGNHAFDPLPQASMIGPSSKALRTTTHGGTMFGIGISAVGWARLTGQNASLYHNRITPAAALLGERATRRIQDALRAVSPEMGGKAILDEMLAPLFQREDPNLPLIAALSKLAVTDGVIKAGEVAETLGIAPFALLRLSQRYFGLTPKLLLRRARFLRSFMHLFVADQTGAAGAIDSSYHDMSHYLRDANTFLGTTPRRFMQSATPFLRESIRARMAVLGTPTQALHDESKLPVQRVEAVQPPTVSRAG